MYAITADDEFTALAFGLPGQNTINYISNSVNTFADKFKNAGSLFLNRAKELYNQYNSSYALNYARSIRNKYLAPHELPNEVLHFNSIKDIQNCSPFMQRWIMTNPNLRENWYFKNRIEGYNDTYNNLFGKCSGEKHYDYRRVMNGLMTDDNENINIYFDDEIENEIPLRLSDQIKILHAWSLTDKYLAEGKQDPTSKEGNDL